MADRIALITGASRGIGAAVARRFAAEGAHVVLVGRTVGGLEEVDDTVRAAGSTATLVDIDITQPGKIEEMAQAIASRFGRLDILVGNAGTLGAMTPLAHLDPKLWDESIALNLTANWRLIRAFDPLLRASDAGRAMFVSSGAARRARAYWGVYATTKAALEMLVQTYVCETEKTAIRVNLIDPGATRTRMRAQAYPGEDPDSLPPPEAITEVFVELAEAACSRHGEVVRAQ